MKHAELARRMRELEQFADLRLPGEAWAIVRADGR